jgi:mannose-1-phosphate guanylyltransferase
MYTIIMAGGSGTRLYPLSTKEKPKQFIQLSALDGTLFEQAVDRALKICPKENIFILTTKEYEKFCGGYNCIFEEKPMGTLFAIYNACKVIRSGLSESDKVFVMTSDHLIEGLEIDENVCDKNLVAFGIKPTSPSSEYGYINPKTNHFKEKPNTETAKEYIKEGYLWNSGMFMFDIDTFISETEKYNSQADIETKKLSVDYGVMEKTDKIAICPLDVSWSDLGSFEAVFRLYDKPTEERPWGSFTVLIDTDERKAKKITVYPNKRLSYQSHEKRSELWVVNQGTATVTLDDKDYVLGKGEEIVIPQGSKHRMANYGSEDLVIIEIQSGSYFGEDDIIRYEDDFGRIE